MNLNQQLTNTSTGRSGTWWKLLFWLMVAVYFADCFTPLRLHVDTIRYFAIKDYWEFHYPTDQFKGDAYYSRVATDYFPYGYTALLILLSKLGILHSFTLVLVNCLYLLGGILFLRKIFPAVNVYALYVLVLINWLFVKFVAHPLSEMQYIFFSLTGAYFYYQFTLKRQFKFVLLALLFSWGAFMTRTIGITLIGAIVVGLVWEYRHQQINFFRKNRVIVITLLAAVAILLYLFSAQLGLDHYREVLAVHLKEASFGRRILWRFKEWGEIFVNLPSNKAIDRLGARGQWPFVLLGLAVFAWFCYEVFFRKNQIPLFLKLYLVFYCLIMFNWPFNDPRFWVPVMPIMAACTLEVLRRYTTPGWKWFSKAWLAVYLALGLFASGYMIYSSFNKSFFVRNQARGVFRNEYETHFYGKPLSDTARSQDPYVLHVLEKFD